MQHYKHKHTQTHTHKTPHNTYTHTHRYCRWAGGEWVGTTIPTKLESNEKGSTKTTATSKRRNDGGCPNGPANPIHRSSSTNNASTPSPATPESRLEEEANVGTRGRRRCCKTAWDRTSITHQAATACRIVAFSERLPANMENTCCCWCVCVKHDVPDLILRPR